MRNDLVVAPVPFEHQIALARAFVQSGLFGIKNESQALALMAICEAEGLHPAKAVQEYHVIQGRPALKSDAMLARFQKAGGKVQWKSYTDARVAGVFSHPSGGEVEIEWTMEQAKRIGLAGKDNWKNYPRAMLRARCISEGVRTVYPGIATGMYTVEEVQDMNGAAPMRVEATTTTPAAPQLPAGEIASLSDDLNASTSLEDLQEKWQALTKTQRQALADTKAAVKDRLIAADLAAMEQQEQQ